MGKHLAEKIVDLFEEQSNESDYINPNFMSEIIELVEAYYPDVKISDKIDKYIQNMWSR